MKLENFLRNFISSRVEQLAHEAEQRSECVEAKKQMLPLRNKAEQLMGKDDAEELISMVRSCDIPIYEYCYLSGLVDGLRLKETLEQMQKS